MLLICFTQLLQMLLQCNINILSKWCRLGF